MKTYGIKSRLISLADSLDHAGLHHCANDVDLLLQKISGELIELFPEKEEEEESPDSEWLVVLSDGETYDSLNDSAAVEVYPDEMEEINGGVDVQDVVPSERWYDLGYLLY